jgi:cytidine deaminase
LSDSSRRKTGEWSGDRRGSANRRSGADRRRKKHRRKVDVAPPGDERREGNDRRVQQRRGGTDRRSEAGWQPVPIEHAMLSEFKPEQSLVEAAIDARRHAQAAYSGFKVGAALEADDGRVVTGCNIENATYGLTLCAERVALVKALSEGITVFSRIAVVADTQDPTPPCGPCRQLLWEYCGDIDVILANLTATTGRHRLAQLLPLPFDRRLLLTPNS